ncbi:O147 family O-antigen flippase [Escherichia coli]|uniref:O147 family O-antigen flippase n=1 Tax=Escherichia coli TaxID=562 RepID=UPI001050133F|nr:O147 family O-antigen flippase [Escherichia coli]EHP0083488.1 O147 family O-antigen flippase [Escherichia coli]EHT5272171.1 O147 family O-antigen flippase [Escherichia coli]TDA05295.1 flippase [Escherichia coli]GDM61744.1 transporter [Escherichia coli]HAO0313780.1 O147 family O-antigen flippase [Escherichia coli]
MSIVKNTLWNISGYIIPSLIAIPALGILSRILGAEQFGLFTLAIALVGYASIFDAGLTRAVIREVSIYKNVHKELRAIISTSTVILTILGLIGGSVLFLSSNVIVKLLNINANHLVESVKAIYIISATIPLYLLNQVWLGIFEGMEKFRKVNLIKSINNSFVAGLPVIFCFFHGGLLSAIYGLVMARVLSLIVTFIFSRKLIISSGLSVKIVTVKRLIGFGSWITVSNIISPIMTYMDRFILSHIVGADKVSFYTAPSEGIQRLTILPSALSRAIFPRLSSELQSVKQTKILSYFIMVIGILPIVILIIILSDFIMSAWMGPTYHGTPGIVLKILAIGFFFNCIAQIPFVSVQASGRSKITAIIHLLEVIPYLCILYIFIYHWGIVGAAIAWSVRTSLDFLILFLIDKKY